MQGAYKAKICGNTNLEDARLAAAAGADYFGVVVDVDFSPRSLSIDDARPIFSQPPLPAVALVFEMPADRIRHLVNVLEPFAIQFLGHPQPDLLQEIKRDVPAIALWQSIHLPANDHGRLPDDLGVTLRDCIDAGVDALLLDSASSGGGKTRFGGTGQTFDWRLAGEVIRMVPDGLPVWLAGGINPDNVTAALEAVHPYGIDLCSGVEARPGKKDPDKINRLMDAIRMASAKDRG